MHRRSTIITKHTAALWLSLASLVFAGNLMAHGGFDHVIGTVVKVDNNVLTVKTAKADVDVRLNDQTEITKGDQKAQIADLKPGTRVVVDVPEGGKDKTAHSIKVGVAAATATHTHDAHK